MHERLMHNLGLEVSGPTLYKSKLRNNTSMNCVGIVKGVRVIVSGVEVVVDMYMKP